MSISDTFKIIFASLGSMVGLLFGENNKDLLIALVIFVVVDYVTGVLKAISERELSSSVGFRGIASKIVIFAIVSISHILDERLGLDNALTTAVIYFYIANEGLSIIENGARLGVPMPKKIKEVLYQLRGSTEDDTQDFSMINSDYIEDSSDESEV